MSEWLPSFQRAVQLTGPDELVLNHRKPVPRPGPYQLLCRVEAVGLCFSDLKLLKQFSHHPRKSEIISGTAADVLAEIPSYAPGHQPTVPGHEAVVRVAAVGEAVSGARAGQRYLVQTDYRWLPTEHANASFGYNFEGALQEYVLLDQRIITSPQGESMLIPASEDLAASAVALVEPWACVEDAYATRERRTPLSDGEMLVAAAPGVPTEGMASLLACGARPARITWLGPGMPAAVRGVSVSPATDLAALPDAAFDDVVALGARPETVETLFGKVAPRGLFLIACAGRRFARPVAVPVGRTHYGGIRLVGTTSADPADALRAVPGSGELRPGEVVEVVGAAGPMGAMHVIRDLCQGVPGITVLAADLDDVRLASLRKIAEPLAAKHNVAFHSYNPQRERPSARPSYVVVMVPAPSLVAEAVSRAAEGGIINVFAGIPAEVTAPLDLDAYITKGLYMIGTSGSVLGDMRTVLAKVESGQLDTNLSVAAVSGLEGAVGGLRAVERREVPGKVIVYPACRGLGLTRLEELPAHLPQVAARLDEGKWTRMAEEALLAQWTGREHRRP